ncbi:unnamed protein product, partial [Cuscuta europaea]
MAGDRSSSKKQGKGVQTPSISTRSRAAAGFNVLEGLDENFPTLTVGNSGTKLSGKTAALQVAAIDGGTAPAQGINGKSAALQVAAIDGATTSVQDINGKPLPAGNPSATTEVLTDFTKPRVFELVSPAAGTVPPAAGSEKKTPPGKSSAPMPPAQATVGVI